MSEHLLGIDWGSTNRRAYLLDGAGRCLRRHADGHGMLSTQGRFAEALDDVRRILDVPAATRVVMSGMVGSAQGWVEAPYLTPDVPLAHLPRHLVPVPGTAGVAIVPGYCQRSDSIDVMRGEETQLLGAEVLGHGDGWTILPGTHSKWVDLRDGRIARWSTWMTGELFALLGQGGTLSALLAQAEDGNDDPSAFEAGLAQAKAGEPLSHALFTVRARVVTGLLPASLARAWVSGLLIGTEFAAAALPAATLLTIIGSPALARRYQIAASFFRLRTHTVDPDQAYCAALGHFLQSGTDS